MNMKKYILGIIALLILATACEEDFLKRLPIDKISTADYWKTKNDLKLFINRFYSSFSDGGAWAGGIYWFDTGTDNMVHNNYDKRLAGARVTSTEGGWNYSRIRSVNYFLENYNKCEDGFDTYKQYVGEAFFFRAYFYSQLLHKYGAVPWIDKTLQMDSEELYKPRTPRNELVVHIAADLDSAITYMKSGPNVSGMRLNKEIAMLFKSRVCLYEGTWEKYHAGTPFGVSGANGTNFIQMAADVAEELIDGGVYGIFSTGDPKWDYWHLFNPYDYTGNKEVMLWKKYDIELDRTHNHQRYLSKVGGGRGITKSLVDDYLCTDGLPASVSPLYQGDASTEQVVANRDPRIRQTMYTPGFPMEIVGADTLKKFERSHLWASDANKCTTGYQLCKGALPDPEQSNSAWVGTNPSPIFRYAEALLNFAEAKAELGTLTQSDVDKSINLLRDRVGMLHFDIANITTDPNWLFPDLSAVINEVRRERRIELACEGFRWDDLARWRAHHLIVNVRPKGAIFNASEYPELTIGKNVFVDGNGYVDPYQKSLASGYEFDPERDYLESIPTEQLTLNDKLVQNPGWDK
jgi:hypothetical protein